MHRKADSGWLPTLVGVLAFTASLLVGRALDRVLSGAWGTAALLVLTFGGLAAYGAWRRQQAERRVELEPHEVPPPAAKERWPQRLVGVLFMALAAAVIYVPMSANRTPAPKPAPLARQQQGDLLGHFVSSPHAPGGWRMVARGQGVVESVGPDGSLAGWVYYRGDGKAEAYDHQNHLLKMYAGFRGAPPDYIAIRPLLDRSGRRIGTAVVWEEIFVDGFDLNGQHLFKMHYNPEGVSFVFRADGTPFGVVHADGRFERLDKGKGDQ